MHGAHTCVVTRRLLGFVAACTVPSHLEGMILPRTQRGTGVPIRSGLIALIVAAIFQVAASPAAAQVEPTPVEPDIKGMVGMGLIGTELGFVIPALAGGRDAWMYVVFPIAGAGGGAALGYFLLEKGASSPDAAVASLVSLSV